MASKEQVKSLITHYENIQHSTKMLMQFCGMRGTSLIDGYREVCERIADLQTQLAEMKE